MKKITNSFIRNIVRQSLNESYGLLNEYDIKTTTLSQEMFSLNAVEALNVIAQELLTINSKK